MLIYDDMLYIVGCFTITKNGMPNYQNIAKKNISSGEWLNIDPPEEEGCIYTITEGSVIGSSATLYVSGDFQGLYNAIAGCTNKGQWVDNCLNGLTQTNCKQLVYDQGRSYDFFHNSKKGTFYLVCENYETAD